MHKVPPGQIETSARHPRDHKERVEGTVLIVRALDAIDGTPVLDIKPYMREFDPIGPLRQPQWSHELMRDYYKGGRSN